MLRFALAVIFLAVAACQPAPVEAPKPGMPGLSSCGGDPALALIGRPVTELPASGNWGTLRVISPGMAVTEDYSETRLNVEIDENGLILGATCG